MRNQSARIIILLTFFALLMPLSGSRVSHVTSPPIGLSENRKLHRAPKDIYKLIVSGQYVKAIPKYRAAIEQARRAGKAEIAQKLLNNLGACEMALFHYREALEALEEARQIHVRSGDSLLQAGLNLNISSLFLQLGNVAGAERAAERGISYLPRSGYSEPRSKLLMQLAAVKATKDDLEGAERLFSQAIDSAYDAGDPATAAWGWEHLGSKYLELGRLADADRVLTESFRIRILHKQPSVNSYWQLAMVRAALGDFRSANVLVEGAFREMKRPGNTTSPWNIYGARGRIRMLEGDMQGAVSDLRIAHDVARAWRVSVIGNDANRTSTETGLSERVYANWIEAGNRLAIQTNDRALAQETFEAAEENRAASLRALAPQKNDWRSRLPERYWELLRQLQFAELQLLQEENPDTRAAVDRVRAELEQMEASAGSPAQFNERPVALEQTQAKLDAGSVLLSFHLGEQDSWLWAVTRNRFAIYRLPAKSELGPEIRKFERNLREKSPLAAESGATLYQALFGSVSTEFTDRQRWLLALDEDLFSLPFSALVSHDRSGSPVYLTQLHTLQITSGALMLGAPSGKEFFSGSFLGIGDPIYNHADVRWKAPSTTRRNVHSMLQFPAWTARASSPPAFARLWGTGEEIRSSARQWNAPASVLLSGEQANKAKLWNEVQKGPAVIHFATHILEAQGSLHTGWIALSLDPDGQPEFLEPAEISARVVAAKLVVLSGCSSGSAEVRAASGLMGLTRAFIAAGAGSVLATRWPTIDDSGQFVTNFYGHLRENPSSGPAAALQAAQAEAISAGDWRSNPQFWASYFLTGNKII